MKPLSEDFNRIPGSDADVQAKALDRVVRAAVARLFYFTLFLAVLFIVYGFMSFGFIRDFDPSVTLWDNVRPRIIYCSVPLFVLAGYIRKTPHKNLRTVFIWLVTTCLVFDVAALIHVWPIAWRQGPAILLFVNATNSAFFSCIALVLSLPFRFTLVCAATVAALVWTPLAVVAFHNGDQVAARTVVSDAIFLSLSVYLLSLGPAQALFQLAVKEVQHELEAAKFLGPVISKAIFEEKKGTFEQARVKGFVACLDIRDSTELQKIHKDRWLDFRKEYFAVVARAVESNHGYIQKTVGDCHFLNFGIMDWSPELSDIPGIERDEHEADERRLEHVSNQAFRTLDEIYRGFHRLAEEWFPGTSVRLGGGIDKGFVERSVQGGAQHFELDVNGDPVNCSQRLQEYSKLISTRSKLRGSVLVVSPFASDYITDLQTFRRLETQADPIRNYGPIRWVLFREYGIAGAVGVDASEKKAA